MIRSIILYCTIIANIEKNFDQYNLLNLNKIKLSDNFGDC